MKPVHETIIREYGRGYFDVEYDGRVFCVNSRKELSRLLKRKFDLPDDPELTKRLAELEQDTLNRSGRV